MSRSANRSTTVKRASDSSCPLSAAPLRLRSVAAARRSFTRSHLSDSGIARLIQSVSSAGATPSIEELAQGDADRDDQRIGFVAVEDPAQVGCDQRLPLGGAKGAIPGLCSCGDISHGVTSKSLASAV